MQISGYIPILETKMLRTISISLNLTATEEQLLFRCLESYRDLFNDFCGYAFANRQVSKKQAQKDMYFVLRDKYPDMLAQLVQTARDQAMEACKMQAKKGWKTCPHRVGLQAIRHNKNTMRILKKNSHLSIGYHKDLKPLHCQVKFARPADAKRFAEGKLRSSTLVWNSEKRKFFVNLCLLLPDPPAIPTNKVVGIDRGIKNLAVLSNGVIFSGNEITRNKRRIAYLKRCLQRKGTRSAMRHLRRIARTESRYIRNVNHVISKRIAESDADTFVMENLKGINKKNRGTSMNRKIHGWSHFQLKTFLEYKAEGLGKKVVYVDPAYTSQRCSFCGFTAKANRKGSRFTCGACNKQLHADLNAAINIRNSHLDALRLDGQASVNRPIVMSREVASQPSEIIASSHLLGESS